MSSEQDKKDNWVGALLIVGFIVVCVLAALGHNDNGDGGNNGPTECEVSYDGTQCQ